MPHFISVARIFRMKNPVIVVGMGEMGSAFARGFLRLGYPVHPVMRGIDMTAVEHRLGEPELVVIAVAEKNLQAVLLDSRVMARPSAAPAKRATAGRLVETPA